MPFVETEKAKDGMGYSYAHLWDMLATIFLFFTVYGFWGRPDVTLIKLTKRFIDEMPIYIYLISAAGYVVPRRMQTIAATGDNLVAAVNPNG